MCALTMSAAAVVAGPGDSGRLEFTFQLRDILTVGIPYSTSATVATIPN